MTSERSGEQGEEKEDPRTGRDLTRGSIPRHVVAFATPMLAGNLLQTAYSFINAFWVGKFLGTSALAAVTVSQPVVFVTIASAAGLTLATNVLIAQHYGAREWDRLRHVVQTSISLVMGVSLLLLLAGQAASRRLLQVMHTPPDIFLLSLGYLHIVLWTLPLSFAIFLIAAMLRGIGDSKTPVYFQVVSVLLNAALDPLLMFGWLGFPRLGLNGTAWATLFSQAVAVVALLLYMPRRRPLVAPDWRALRIDTGVAGLLIVIGIPAMVQQSVVSVSMVFIVSFVSRFGSLADGAFGAALRIDGVAFLPALTVGTAVSTLAGQNIGAGLYGRVRSVFWWGLALSGSISLAIAVLVIAFPRVPLRLFLSDPRAIEIGAGYLRIVGGTYFLYAVMFVANGVINGAGHTFATTVISILNLWGVRLPLAWYFATHTHQLTGIWRAMLTSVATGMVLSLAYYASGRWRAPVGRPRRGEAAEGDGGTV